MYLAKIGGIPKGEGLSQAHFAGVEIQLVAPSHVPNGHTACDEADALVVGGASRLGAADHVAKPRALGDGRKMREGATEKVPFA